MFLSVVCFLYTCSIRICPKMNKHINVKSMDMFYIFNKSKGRIFLNSLARPSNVLCRLVPKDICLSAPQFIALPISSDVILCACFSFRMLVSLIYLVIALAVCSSLCVTVHSPT